LHADILRRKDIRIVVEFEPQARIEGEIQQLGAHGLREAQGLPAAQDLREAHGLRDASSGVIELADVLRGRLPGRVTGHEVTLFDSVGFALNDFSALRYLQRLNAEQPGGGEQIDLIPDLEDPKDLFAGFGRARAPVRRRRVA
jgi:ornithine cyclodeaminase